MRDKDGTFFRDSGRDVNLPTRPYSKFDNGRVPPLQARAFWQIFITIDAARLFGPGSRTMIRVSAECRPPAETARLANH
ncbi:MAG: hypothetical protein AAAC47_23380, partial [Pararhizobium sp.]